MHAFRFKHELERKNWVCLNEKHETKLVRINVIKSFTIKPNTIFIFKQKTKEKYFSIKVLNRYYWYFQPEFIRKPNFC